MKWIEGYPDRWTSSLPAYPPSVSGQQLASIEFVDGTCIFDPKNGRAHLIGPAVNLGTVR